MNELQRPLLRYHGGKWRLAPWIVEHFPPHRVYVEPFGGGGSVLMHKSPAITEVYNDRDDQVVQLFRVLRDPASAAELVRRLELTPFARADYEDWCYEPGDGAVDVSHRLIARSFMGMSSKGIWQRSGFDTRINPDGYASRIAALRNTPDAIRSASARFMQVIVENEDALVVIGRHDREDALIYCDPPYVSDTYNTGRIYTHHMTDAQHRALASMLHAARGMVAISGYHGKLYDELFGDWERRERASCADTGAQRVEVLWLNPACAALQRQAQLPMEHIA